MEVKDKIYDYAKLAAYLEWVPIPLRNKIPAVKNWQNLRADPNDIEKRARQVLHLIDNNAANNYGILTGEPSGIVVIDVEESGLVDWFQLLNSNKKDIPYTFTVKTPGGGYHYYFQYEDKLRNIPNMTKIAGKDIDYKTTGGMVVGPGSSIDGKQYIVTNGYDAKINKVYLAAMPEWLREYLIGNLK